MCARLRVCEEGSAAAAAAVATRPDQTDDGGSGWSRLRRYANKSCCAQVEHFLPTRSVFWIRFGRLWGGRTEAGHRQTERSSASGSGVRHWGGSSQSLLDDISAPEMLWMELSPWS